MGRRACIAIAFIAVIPARAGVVTAPGLKDRAVTLYRCGPWGTASTEITLPFVNTATTADVRVTPDVVSSDLAAANAPARVVHGTITIRIPQTLPHGSTDAKLNFSGFHDAGVFQTRLFVRTSAEGPLDEIPFKIIVTDRMPFPLLAIILGVLLGVTVNLIATRFRPAEDVRARAFALAASVMSLRERAGDPALEAQAQNILEELMRISRAAITEDAASLRARLDILRLQIDALNARTAQLIAPQGIDFSMQERIARRHVLYADVTLAVIALFVSVLTGLWVLWTGKVFGTPANYIEAFVWGLGVDSSVRGFGAVLKRLSGP